MFRTLLPHCSLAVFILSCSLPAHGRPAQGLSGRVRRAVSEHQLLHDKGRSLQELRRRIFLHNLIEGVNTAEIRAVPDESPRPAPSAKNFNSLGLVGEQDGGAHLPQETHKVLSYKEPLPKTPGKKKKGKPGKRKEQDKRKRRERSALERLQEPPGSASWWEELNLRSS